MRISPVFFAIVLLSSCTYSRIIHRNFPNVTDYKIFPQAIIERSEQEFKFERNGANLKLPDQNIWGFKPSGKRIKNSKSTLEAYLEKNNTTSLIVIRHDTILYENYFNGYQKDTRSIHFSINKAIMSILTSIAIKEGAFKGIDQKIGDFIPMYSGDERGEVTIGNLVSMNAGFDANDYGQQMRFIRLYYSKTPQKFMAQRKIKYPPGEHFAYSSFNSMLLALCMEKATKMPLNEYMEQKLWKKLGMSYNASMSTFKDGTPMAWGGLASYPIDLVKFGKLLLDNGAWEGEDLIPEYYIRACKDRSENKGKVWLYSKGFWLDTFNCLKEEDISKYKFMDQKCNCDNENELSAIGYRGQVLYIDFEKELIILRLGTGSGRSNWSRGISKLGSLL